MAILNNLKDVNELLKTKGIQPVQVDSYDLTVTDEKVKSFVDNPTEEVHVGMGMSFEQQFIHQSIQEVIQHYQLDEVNGYYGIESEEEISEEEVNQLEKATSKIRQGIHYQVLNQKKILWEFYKRNCYRQQKESYLTRFEELYVLAVHDVDRMIEF